MKLLAGVMMEVVVSAGLQVVVVSILSLLIARLLQRQLRPKLKLPPSPFFSLPFVGHLFHVCNAANHAFLQGLRHKLGPIFTLYVGTTPLIYITSADLAHKALVQQGLLFATRPPFLSVAGTSIVFAPYGPAWRSLRRNLAHEVLTVPKILSFTPARTLVLDHMISRILAEARNNDGVVSLYPNIRYALFQLQVFVCFGFHMPEDAMLQTLAMMDERFSMAATSIQDHFLPQVMAVLTWKRRRAECAMRAELGSLYAAHFKKHQELQKQGELAPGSYLETLFHLNTSTPLSTASMIDLCMEFLLAGVDTTVVMIEWTMAHLVEDRSLQSKLYDEIHDVVEGRLVEEKDLPSLPFLQALIKESLRLHPPGHFLVPHAVSNLCKLEGYDIPPNAIVLFHQTSMSRDAHIWEEPLTFKPERFLHDAAVDLDITGTKHVKMLPFGAGRRICPGLALASMHMELFVARLVQAFHWFTFPIGKTVDFTESPISLNVRMKHTLKALVKEAKA